MIDAELLGIFRAEAQELLPALSRVLVQLEAASEGEGRAALVREAFRLAHTLKGASSTAQREDFAQVAHVLEDTLHALREGRLEPDPTVIGACLEVVDLLTVGLHQTLTAAEAQSARARLTRGAPSKAPPERRSRSRKRARKDLRFDLLRQLASWATSRDATELATVQRLSEQVAAEAAATLPRTTAVASALVRACQRVAQGAPAEPLVAACFVAADFLDTDATGGASDEELAVVLACLEKVVPASPAAFAAPAVPLGAEEATVRVRVTLLDSILFRLEELVAARLRLDHQRHEVEGLQEDLRAAARGAAVQGLEPLFRRLESVRRDLTQEVHQLGVLAHGIQDDVREVRMVPVGPVLEPLRRVVRDLSAQFSRQATLVIEGSEVRVDKRLLEVLRDPLTHLVRNAVDHGIEGPEERVAAGKARQGTVTIRVESRESQVWIEVRDDGRGVSLEQVRTVAIARGLLNAARAATISERETLNLVFIPGFSTSASVTEVSGRGVGLDVVRAGVARLGGRIDFYSSPQEGTRFLLSLPLTLAATRGLMVRSRGKTYCLPLPAIEETLSVEVGQLGVAQGRLVLGWRRQAVAAAQLSDLFLGVPSAPPEGRVPAVILALSDRRLAVLVDELLDQQEVVVKSLAPGTPRLPFVAGAVSLADGRLVTMLEPSALLEAALLAPTLALGTSRRRKTVLLADDSLTSRTMVSTLLEQHGYHTLAVPDGEAALAAAARERVDAVVTDAEMPVVDGFELTRRLRGREGTARTPIVILTSLGAAEDRARGAAAGADAYLVKGEFSPGPFLALLAELLARGDQR